MVLGLFSHRLAPQCIDTWPPHHCNQTNSSPLLLLVECNCLVCGSDTDQMSHLLSCPTPHQHFREKELNVSRSKHILFWLLLFFLNQFNCLSSLVFKTLIARHDHTEGWVLNHSAVSIERKLWVRWEECVVSVTHLTGHAGNFYETLWTKHKQQSMN